MLIKRYQIQMTSFMTTTVLNTKITETENKKLDTSDVGCSV